MRIALWLSIVSLLPGQSNPPPPDPAASEPVKTSITVNEQISAESPAAITVLERRQVMEQPSLELDDRLRSVPGFSLFRRSSSLVANPTTQGVSLRGLGSSGASRSLVLWDGIPINDPFGGWVYWSRIAPDEIDRVEISRGASTSVFGDRAMSGAIALFSRPVEARRIRLAYEGGNENTHMVSAAGSHLWRNLGISGTGRAITTDGYFVVPAGVRGGVDEPAAVRATAGDVRIDWLGGAQRLFVKFDLLAEDRDNGTRLTRNSTSLGDVAAHYALNWKSETLSVLGYHTREEYRSTFSSVSNNRNTERLTFVQTVPSEATGGAGLWRHSGAAWHLLGGADLQRVEGWSTDRLVPSGVRVGGGSQFQRAGFVQGDVAAGPLQLFAGGRYQWTGQGQTLFSPSGGMVLGRGFVRGRGSVYRSFRAPTLNELFREFRVGNTITRANPNLQPETMFGAEAGVDLVGESRRMSVTAYRHALDDLITNVTLSSGSTIVRQRQNAGAAVARGFEASLRQRWGPLAGEAGYLFADSRYSTGLRIPQVPRHQGNAQLSYSTSRVLLSAGVRSYSAQFEDDLNSFLLPGFATVQFVARVPIGKGVSASFALDNALDREYAAGFSPTPLIGQPRLWRAGLRWN